MKKVSILGIKIDNLSFLGAVRKITAFIENGGQHHVVTVNPEFIIASQKDKEFARILNSASLSIPDGTGLLWASKFLYGEKSKLKERVTGVDLVWELAKMAAEKKWSIYFLGARPGVAKIAVQRLKTLYPTLKIAGISEGEPKISPKTIIKDIKNSKTDILLVAYGAPKQDKFIAQNLSKMDAKVAIGVGGTFDFIAGIQKRAPIWMQKMGLEWLFRLLREPKRIGRIFTATIKFPITVIWSKYS